MFTENSSGSVLTASSAAAKTDAIRKCLVSGLFPNAAYLHISGSYRSVRGDIPLAVHPTSGIAFVLLLVLTLVYRVFKDCFEVIRDAALVVSELDIVTVTHL